MHDLETLDYGQLKNAPITSQMDRKRSFKTLYTEFIPKSQQIKQASLDSNFNDSTHLIIFILVIHNLQTSPKSTKMA